jgi:hypothetical protein
MITLGDARPGGSNSRSQAGQFENGQTWRAFGDNDMMQPKFFSVKWGSQSMEEYRRHVDLDAVKQHRCTIARPVVYWSP